MTDSTTTVITTTPTETVKVTYDGKDYYFSVEFTQDPDVLKQVLSASGLAGAANALVEPQADGSILLVKRGGPNGVLLAEKVGAEAEPASDDSPLYFQPIDAVAGIVARLSCLETHINPAVQLDWELRQREWRGTLTLTNLLLQQGVIDKAILDGKAEYEKVNKIMSRLEDCGSIPDQRSPGLM